MIVFFLLFIYVFILVFERSWKYNLKIYKINYFVWGLYRLHWRRSQRPIKLHVEMRVSTPAHACALAPLPGSCQLYQNRNWAPVLRLLNRFCSCYTSCPRPTIRPLPRLCLYVSMRATVCAALLVWLLGDAAAHQFTEEETSSIR